MAMDKREVAEAFRDRLKELLKRSGLNQARLAAAAGVDRSALAQLMSEAAPRLPRAETLVNLARSQGVSLDWLLGLSDEDTVATEVTPTLAIEEGVRGSDVSRLEAWRKEAVGTKIRYVPSTLPDLLRLPEVIAHEHELDLGPSSETRIAQAHHALDYTRRPETDMEVCMPRQRLVSLAHGDDMWSDLPKSLRQAQLDHMARLTDELYPTFRLFLYDAREAFSGAYTVYGQQRAAIYLGDLYLVLTAKETILRLSQHFDQLIRRSIVASHEAPLHVARLAQQVS